MKLCHSLCCRILESSSTNCWLTSFEFDSSPLEAEQIGICCIPVDKFIMGECGSLVMSKHTLPECDSLRKIGIDNAYYFNEVTREKHNIDRELKRQGLKGKLRLSFGGGGDGDRAELLNTQRVTEFKS